MFEIKDEMCGKRVRVTCVDGDILVGRLTEWTTELDNDPEPESITLDDWLEITLPEIEKVEIIGK